MDRSLSLLKLESLMCRIRGCLRNNSLLSTEVMRSDFSSYSLMRTAQVALVLEIAAGRAGPATGGRHKTAKGAQQPGQSPPPTPDLRKERREQEENGELRPGNPSESEKRDTKA